MNIDDIDKMLDMQLHEEITVDKFTQIRRTVGGWVYTELTEQNNLSCCFVPEPQHLLNREQPCRIYGHRFKALSTEEMAQQGVARSEASNHFLCDKCGELVKSV